MKKILVAADIATHPCTGGNNQCIMQYVACLRNIGFDVYYLLIGSNELSARSIEETKAFWGERFFYYRLPWWQSCYMKVYKHITRQAYPDNIDFYSPLGIVGFVNRLHKKYDFTGIVVNYIWQSRLAHCIIPIKAIFTHDVFTYRNERIATGNNWHHHSAKEEARGVRRFPNILAIQDIERSYFSFLSPHSDVWSVYSNFTFVEQPVTGNKNILFFSGNNGLNLEAIKCFIDQVFMQLLSFDSEVRLLLGGNICSAFNLQELPPNIELKGRYENPDDFYLLGDIAINYLSAEKALKEFSLDIKDKIMVDIGSSTGGFTDCALQNGAKLVYAVDVGTNQLVWKLRNDPRVIVKEQTNFRYATIDLFQEGIPTLASIDVSFISLKHIFNALKNILKTTDQVVALIKPQFEAGKEDVGKKGIVKDKKIHCRVIKDVIKFAKEDGFTLTNLTYSPITGGEGNIEFLGLFIKDGKDVEINIEDIVNAAHNCFER